MHGIGAGGPGGRDEGSGIEISVGLGQPDPGVGLADMRGGGVGIGVHRDGAQPEPATAGEDPAGDLPAVGDQDLGDHSVRAPVTF